MWAVGVNGQINFDGEKVVISRKGIMGFLNHGLKGDKTILFSSITSIQFKPAGMLTNGYIQFAFQGGKDAKGGIMQATQDENTVMFKQGDQQRQFEGIRHAVQKAMFTPAPASSSPPLSLADELKKLAELRDAGVLTQTEFEQQKAKLLT